MKLVEDTIDLDAYLEPASPGENVLPASSFYEQVRDDFLNPIEQAGAVLPWPKTEQLIRLRPAEVSLWVGVNGSGKSMLTSQVATSLCMQGERVCIASLEMRPRKTLYRMTRQAAGGPEPSLRFIKGFHTWTDDKLWMFDHVGQVEPSRVIAVIRYCATQLRVTHFFLDSLMRCVRGEDDYNGQKDFVTDLCNVTQETDIHVHLIHHPKKPPDESHRTTRFDAKGSGAISDQVDNCFSVWRNRAKERQLETDTFENEGEREDCARKPDALVICDKQRNGEWEGQVTLWYDRRSMTYRGDQRPPITHGIDIPMEAAQ